MPTDSIPSSTSTTYALTINTTTTNYIDTGGDQDWYRVSLNAGVAYTFRLEGQAVNGIASVVNPYLRLLDGAGNQIGYNDDGGGNFNALLTYTPSSSGTFYLSAQAVGDRTGGYGLSATAANRAPTAASPIPDQSWNEGTAGSLAFSSSAFSDADGDTLTYAASQSNGSALPSWLTFTPATRTFAGTPPTGTADLTVRVTASDGRGGTVTDDFNLATPTPNRAPVAMIIPNQSWNEGQSSTLTWSASTFTDPDGDALTLFASQSNHLGTALPSWLTFNPTARSLTGTPPAGSSDYTIRISATDGRGGSTSTAFNLVTPSVNRAPTVAIPIPDQSWNEGTAGSLAFSSSAFSDADGDTLTYAASQSNGSALPSWLTFTPASRTFAGTPPAGTADLTVRVTASDGRGGTVTDDFTLATPTPNRPPVAGTIADQTWNEGQAGSFTVPTSAFSDADGDTLTFAAALSNGNALPSWLTFTPASRLLTGTPPAGSPDLVIRITAADGRGGSAYDDFNLATPAPNRAPTAGTIANQTWNEGQAGTFTVPTNTFSDADGDTLTLAATLVNGGSLPSWLNFNASTLVFAGTPPAGSDDLVLRISAADGRGGSANTEFNLATPVANRSPTVTRPSPLEDQYLLVGESLSYTLPATTFTDPDGDPLTYTVRNLPSWASFNAATRALTGSPTVDGDFSVQITARDAGNLSATTMLDLYVDVEEENHSPTLDTPIPDRTWREGRTVRFVIPRNTFSDPDDDPLTYTATLRGGRSLPNWLTFNPNTRTFVGRAPVNGPDLTVRVTAADAEGLRVSDDVLFRTVNNSGKPGAMPLASSSNIWQHEALTLTMS